MRIGRMRTSGNVIDRRGLGGGGRMAVGGGVGGLILVVLMLVLGINPLALLGPGGGPSVMVPGGGPATAQERAAAEFVARVLGDTEDVWNDLFQRQGLDY